MNFLSANNISKSYGVKALFENISFHVNEGDRIALVAKNGSGKTTLLKILSGIEKPDTGEVLINKIVKVLLFEQNDNFDENQISGQYIFNHSNPVLDVIRRYEELIQSDSENLELLKLTEEMDQLNAWQVEPIVQEILLKLKIDFLGQKVGELSGGQRKRISLAKFLIDMSLTNSHLLLILDEPTNHLDIDMVEWLEFFLNKENKTLILVTHDRYFLDSVCNKIIEIEDSEVFIHNGGYQVYVTNKAMRIENRQVQTDKAINLYKKELEWMRRQPQARTTKSKDRITAFYEIKEKANKKTDNSKLQLDMQMSRLGKKIIEMKNVSKRFGNKIILNNFSHFFGRGNKIGIIGKNGVGKTTFLRIIEASEKIDSGIIELGETLKIGYFRQEGILYKQGQRAIDFVKELAEHFPLSNGRQLSASQFMELFLFNSEQQYSPIEKLSGGEKKRLQLLSVLFRNPNFLILDEPTNDLDLPTLSVLENFLNDFEGCLFVVSHDRYFMDRVVDELMVFEGDGRIKWFVGNYTEYFLMQKQLEETAKSKESTIDTEFKKTDNRKLSYKEKKELENLDKEISELQDLKEKLTLQISDSGLSYDEISKISSELETTISKLQEKENRWFELSILNENL